MKILFGIPVNVHKEIAEAEVKAFKDIGNEVEVSYYGNSNAVEGIVSRFFLILKNAINLKRKLNKHKSDIIYLNTAFDKKTVARDSISIFILKLFNSKIKIVLKTHGTIESVVSSKNILNKYLSRNVDLFLVLSREELNNFKNSSFAMNNIQVTANPVDFTNYHTDSNFKRSLNIEETTITLLFVGRFLKQKGILDLIYACKLAKENSLIFKLICLGDGPLFDEVTSLAKKLNLENEINFLGHIPELETKYFYSNCDITILPSYREGFPMAIFQAVAAGQAVITTKVNACADYFTEYENCLWVEKENPRDLSQKIITLAKNAELRAKIRVNNLLLAKKFTSERIARNLNEKFEELLNEKYIYQAETS